MDGTKISQLPLLNNLSGNEDTVLAVNGQNFKFKLSQLKTFITKNDLGLGNVDNTSDANKPVSTAQAQALAGKADVGHQHAVGDVTGLQQALDGKAASQHGHTVADVDGLQDALDNKAAQVHGHEISEVNGLIGVLNNKTDIGHGHSMADVNNLVPTIQGLQTQIGQKAPSIHGHDPSEINGLDAHIVAVVQNAGISGDVVVGATDW
jgi:hypothetical protein